MKAGDIVVIASGGGWSFGVESYALGRIERTTAKKVFTVERVHCRGSHDRHLVTPVRDEASARLLLARLESAGVEFSKRRDMARMSYNETRQKLLAAARSDSDE